MFQTAAADDTRQFGKRHGEGTAPEQPGLCAAQRHEDSENLGNLRCAVPGGVLQYSQSPELWLAGLEPVFGDTAGRRGRTERFRRQNYEHCGNATPDSICVENTFLSGAASGF